MVLRIRKLSFPQIMAMIIFIVPFLLNVLQELLYVPGIIKYTIDVAWVFSSLSLICNKRQFVHKSLMPYVIFFCIWFVYVTVVYLFHYQSIFYFLWGFRNNARYFITFVLFAYYFDKEIVNWCLKFIDIAFIIHSVTVFFQFFVLGYKWDYLGGIFGTQLGCNGNSLILLVIVCTKSLILFMNDQEKIIPCLLKCAVSLIIATMSELKAFFLFFVVIAVASALITKFSAKKVFLLVGVGFAVFFAGSIFTFIWGENASLNLDRFSELITSTQYSSEKDLGRLTAIGTLSKNIVTGFVDRLFGLGLGNCDTSSFAICNTPFYQSYSFLNYDWFSSAFCFLETGYVGLLLFFSFFVLVFLLAKKQAKLKGENMIHSQIAMVMSIVCVLLVFYNSSLRADIGYLAYFMLAIPFAFCGKGNNDMLAASAVNI